MGKRSEFARRPMDAYQTIDPRAVECLLPHIQDVRTFAEPCSGQRHLVRSLVDAGLECSWHSDIEEGFDALALGARHFNCVDAIITNPPWSRPTLHAMIVHFQKFAPTWLLFDADWCHTKQCAPHINRCSHIVSVGRLRWIEGTKQTGKDNCAWYRFDARHNAGPLFIGPSLREAA